MESNERTNGLTRRTVLKAGGLAATGFALAVQPVSADTITTPTTGLVTEELEVPRGDARIPVYSARPEGAGPFPGVVVIHEIFGLHEHIQDVARRFAQEGYYAMAPELFFREGGVGHLENFQQILQVVRSVPDRQMLDDLGAVLAQLEARPQCNGRIGATGFCWGGGATWLFTADNPGVDAAVAWYGRMVDWGSGELHPNNPIDLAAQMNAPVLGLYGGQDRGIPQSSIDAMKAALAEHDKPHEFAVYPEAGHAFYADYRQSYVESAAEDGWRRCLAWFRRHLRG